MGSQDTTAAAILTLDAAVERLVRNTAEDPVCLEIPRARADQLAIDLTRPNLDIDALLIRTTPSRPVIRPELASSTLTSASRWITA